MSALVSPLLGDENSRPPTGYLEEPGEALHREPLFAAARRRAVAGDRALLEMGGSMARSTKMSVIKRQRERKKAEKAALKREEKEMRRQAQGSGADEVASRSDLEDYGLISPPADEPSEG